MRLKPEQILELSQEFETYKDVLATPGWRKLVDEPLDREIAWCMEEIKTKASMGVRGWELEVTELRSYLNALNFVRDQIVHRVVIGAEASKTFKRRAQQLGLTSDNSRSIQ